MVEIVNTAQAEAWNGYEGSHWADHYDRYDAVNSGFNEPLLDSANIVDGSHVLDIGCGNGQLTLLAAARAGCGYAKGLDLSGPMLRRARSRADAEGVRNVSFEQADAQVYPFCPTEFDTVISRFGIMFFADPAVAFANVGRALRPGGTLAFLAMTSMANGDLSSVLAALPSDASTVVPSGVGPTSFADPDRIGAVLSAADFIDIECRWAEADSIWGRDSADAAEFLAGWGPIRHALKQVDPAVEAGVRSAMADAFSRFEDSGEVRLRGTAWLVTAAKPLQ